ncbi:hypothetical protein [Methylobacterium nodulans]|uniref:Uncharacterized protein n=1 Tax=Methylobacterium nodulans (strain LMG 21967 / CNCM I-2342 / ORS 2060) TaxID=460265 RepID=B8ITS2_METNO|nr:hypothetical protein [Methylobacterium nodulans]ACL58988.1 hypothetical protein Mnod_4109 [Methylobacterium nodulans ORS 2060]
MRAADLREFDFPSLADAARKEADKHSAELAQAFEWQSTLIGNWPGQHRDLKRMRAHATAQRDDLRRLQDFAEFYGLYADRLQPILEALERGAEVTIRQSRAAELVRSRSAVPVRAHWPMMRRPGTVMGPVVVAMAAEVR